MDVRLVAIILCHIALLSGQSTSGRKRPLTTTTIAPRHRPTAVIEDEDSADQLQQESECPEPNGFFADASQCDKYYACSDNKITEKLCPDGMVFNDYSSQQEKCDLPLNIDCSQRPALQPPQPAEHCPRQNGYFAHENPNICDKFYYCVDGKFNAITCPGGLVYNEKSGICTWPDEAKKKGCSSQDVFNFRCPNVTSEIALQHPRYANPEDCQFFYVCVNGDTPRRNGCKMGQVFNEASGKCDWPRNVPECADWYKGVLTDEELYNLENPKPKETSKEKEAAAASRRKPSRPPTTKRTVVEDDE